VSTKQKKKPSAREARRGAAAEIKRKRPRTATSEPLHLLQTAGSREVSGNGGGYEITGVVSGKRLFMLFATSHTVEYCATLSPN
jgi:hypothetical protein